MLDITAVGEVLIDLTQTEINPQGVPVLAANPGGAPANVTVAASRLGARTAFIGKVGQDGFGVYLRRVLQENDVDTSWLRTGDTHTTMAIVTVDSKGERDFQFVRGADCALSPDEVPETALRDTQFFHFGSVSLTRDPARTATLSAARLAHSLGTLVSYDPNYRANLWESQAEAQRWMAEPLPLVDVIKLSEEELPLLTGTEDLEEGSRRLEEESGISLVLVTLGDKGAFCRWKGETFLIPGVQTKVADTNGAGDTFLGAVLSKLCRRGGRPLDGLQTAELKEIVAFANRAASKTCSRSGAIPAMPRLSEV